MAETLYNKWKQVVFAQPGGTLPSSLGAGAGDADYGKEMIDRLLDMISCFLSMIEAGRPRRKKDVPRLYIIKKGDRIVGRWNNGDEIDIRSCLCYAASSCAGISSPYMKTLVPVFFEMLFSRQLRLDSFSINSASTSETLVLIPVLGTVQAVLENIRSWAD